MKSTSKTPLVSIITLAYNSEEFILGCIKSVRSMSEDFKGKCEHIILDDGSTDSTLEIVKANLSSDANLTTRVIELPHTGRLSDIRNIGAKAATGKYMFQLDSDDILLENSIQTMVSRMEKTGEQLVCGGFIHVTEKLQYMPGVDYESKKFESTADLLLQTLYGTHYWPHSFVITHSLFDSVNGYDPEVTFGEDTDLIFRCVFAGVTPAKTPITCILRRRHNKNVTGVYDMECVAYPEINAWLIESQARYFKFEKNLVEWLTTSQLSSLRSFLQITDKTSSPANLSIEIAIKLYEEQTGRLFTQRDSSKPQPKITSKEQLK